MAVKGGAAEDRDALSGPGDAQQCLTQRRAAKSINLRSLSGARSRAVYSKWTGADPVFTHVLQSNLQQLLPEGAVLRRE